MSSPFVAEIRMFACNFAPTGWAFCDGQLLPISQNTALFSLLGTNYGGDGKTNFALPNLQGSVAMHTTQFSSSPFGAFYIGQTGGSDTVTLLSTEMPSHSHDVRADIATGDTNAVSPNGNLLSNSSAIPLNVYSTSANPQTAMMSPQMIGITGGNLPHNNLMPYLTLIYCIAMQGVYPPRT